MSTEENKALVRRLFDGCVNQANLDLADEIFAQNFVDHGALARRRGNGLDVNLEMAKARVLCCS